MFSNKMIVALVGAAMILTTASFAKGVTGNSKPQQQKGKPVGCDSVLTADTRDRKTL